MNIFVLEFHPMLGEKTIGIIKLIYNDLEFNLRLRMYKKEKLYVELPRIKSGPAWIYPIRCPTQEIMDEFQNKVISQVRQRWPYVLNEYYLANNI